MKTKPNLAARSPLMRKGGPHGRAKSGVRARARAGLRADVDRCLEGRGRQRQQDMYS